MAAVIQRPLRGSRVSTFYPVKNLPSLSSLDSAFQLQEYISLLIRLDVHDVEAIISFPGTSEKDKKEAADKEKEESKDDAAKDVEKDGDKAKNEVTVDEGCWVYEQLRRLAQDLSHPLITTLQQECTRASCPEMKAGEWLYLCVAHGNDGAMEQCCAIDYILHTVDSATALLNSPRTFPSRLSIPQTSHRHFASLARRLGRIFAHAYFHHREAFEQAEAESSLYARFLALTEKFNLVPAEFLVIPPNNFPHDDAGPSREREASLYDYNDPGRIAYQSANQHQRPQQGSADHFHPAQKYRQHEYHGLEGEPRHPSAAPSLGESSAGAGSNGGVGESPNVTRSRFGRSRTDTMVFNDSEASAIADELAAKARAGELEPDSDSHDSSSPTRPELEEEEKSPDEEEDEEEEEEGDLEGETQFEISLSPEEEITGTYGEFTEVHAHQAEQTEDTTTNSHSSTAPPPPPEEPPAKDQESEADKAEEPSVTHPVAVSQEQTEVPVEQASEPAELEEVASEKEAQSSTSESAPAPSSTPAPIPDEPASEVESEASPPEATVVTPAQSTEESAPSVKDDVVETPVPPPATEISPSPSEVVTEENQPSAVETAITAAPASSEGTEVVVPAPLGENSEGATSDEITLEEIQVIEAVIGGDVETSGAETEQPKSDNDALKEQSAEAPAVPETESVAADTSAATGGEEA